MNRCCLESKRSSSWTNHNSSNKISFVRRLLVAKASNHQRDVLAAKAKTVGKREVEWSRARLVGDVVQVAIRVGVLVVDRRRQYTVANRHQADDHLGDPGSGNQVAHHALGAGDGRL